MPQSGSERLQSALQLFGLDLPIVTFAESTHTSQEAAAAIGCSVAAIAKSMIFRGCDTDRALLAIMSGINRVDVGKLAHLVGEKVERPDADFVRARTGYAIGGVPPIHAEWLPAFIDEELFALEQIWASAGSPFSIFATTAQELLDVIGGQRADLKA